VARTPAPSSSRGKARSNRDRAGRDRGVLGGGKPECRDGPRARRQSTSHRRGSTLHVEGQRLCGETQPEVTAPVHGYGGTPRAPRPTRLTELPSRVGLRALAAAAELHERVQRAWGHGQVDGVAEGGAGGGREKQRNVRSQGPGRALRHPLPPPPGPRARPSRP